MAVRYAVANSTLPSALSPTPYTLHPFTSSPIPYSPLPTPFPKHKPPD
ncbi:hypothetical protein H6G89_26500 [Oscillatoria sp. FACHB-1407]|nr:hypothetical protein [Oscillatoria sp. FACHB-1407]MBD2464562.1 hypothetical protein [Oscillatoria sp. FACHB-1407]